MWTVNATAFENYYFGLPGNPKLLARSDHSPWEAPPPYPSDSTWEKHPRKHCFPVQRYHPLSEKLDGGLRDSIREVLATMSPLKWISVDYLRIGDKESEKENPVVILVSVEKEQVLKTEAQRITDALVEECKKVGLCKGTDDTDHVQVEVMEGQRQEFRGVDPVDIRYPTEYPIIGDSVGLSAEERCGTLGGYVLVGDKVMGLTAHHVAFGTDRREDFPTQEEADNGILYTFMQPAPTDFQRQISALEKSLKRGRDKLEDCSEINRPKAQKEVLATTESLEDLNLWTPERSVLGKVWRSSGLRRRIGPNLRRFRLDWALIELRNPERFIPGGSFVNEVPRYEIGDVRGQTYLDTGMHAAGLKAEADIPRHLKRGLTFEEFLNKKDTAEQNNNKYVMWKCGRTTQFTFGIASNILSDYRSLDGVVSDEYPVVNHYGNEFSDDGDSGSFVWDSDGYVCGILWGGKDKSSVSYMTPIEYVLEDIQEVCNVDNVRLVTRKP